MRLLVELDGDAGVGLSSTAAGRHLRGEERSTPRHSENKTDTVRFHPDACA